MPRRPRICQYCCFVLDSEPCTSRLRRMQQSNAAFLVALHRPMDRAKVLAGRTTTTFELHAGLGPLHYNLLAEPKQPQRNLIQH